MYRKSAELQCQQISVPYTVSLWNIHSVNEPTRVCADLVQS